MPSRQSFLKQMRQILNLRYTARGRPHSSHRRSVRLLNFGVRFALAIFDLLATVETLHKGIVNNCIATNNPAAISLRPSGMGSRLPSAMPRRQYQTGPLLRLQYSFPEHYALCLR